MVTVTIDPKADVEAGTPALQLAVEKEDCVVIKCIKTSSVCKPGEWLPKGLHAEYTVTGGSGTQIGVLSLHTENMLKDPCPVQLTSPTGEVLMAYETAGLIGAYETNEQSISVQLSGHVYCTASMKLMGVYTSSVSVTRADGSGGTLVEPLEKGWNTARGKLMCLGFWLWIFLVGMFFMCAAFMMPVFGPVKSLDGTAEYAPHSEKRGTHTVNYVADPKDEKKDSYKEYDAKTKVDALIGKMISTVYATLASANDPA